LGRGSFAGDDSVAQHDSPVRAGRQSLLVRHHHHRGALLPVHREQQIQHRPSRGAVQISGGFIRQQDRRLQCKRPRQCHTLLLAAGKLHGIMIESPLQSHAFQQFARAFPAARFGPREFHGKENILFGRKRRNQMVGLEYEADLASAQERHFVFAQMRDLFAIQNYLPRGGRVKPRQESEQRTLSAAGGPHDRGELAPWNLEIDSLQNLDAVSTGVDGFGKRANLNQVSIIASLTAAFFLCACGSKPETAVPRPTTAAPARPAVEPADGRPAIVCFGDSITAGFGLDSGQSFPDLLQQDLDRRHRAYRALNFGVSGDTTQDGLARVPMALAEHPAIVLLELGGNDGLRGLPLSVTQANLAQMIESFQAAGARVILAGMSLPPNYGGAFIKNFEAVYPALATRYHLTLIPFLLAGVGGHDDLMQRDGLHPNAAGARKVEDLVMQTLAPLLN
jgi:acyl-CoA thioesterase I